MMKVKELAQSLNAKTLAGEGNLDKEVSGVYLGDLLSWVMSHAGKGDAWITVLTHLNIVAVALLTEVACIIVPENIGLEEATLKKAEQEGIVILRTDLTAYDICRKASELGV